MKLKPITQNHEVWYECQVCAAIFDRRMQGSTCPECGASTGRKAGKFKKLLMSILIGVLLTACTPHKFAARQKQCRNAQEFAQYLHSVPSHKDPLRTYLFWDIRPKNHWPFNYLQ